MERILLVAPYFKEGLGGFPLGLSYIAGALKDEHDVSVLDLTARATVSKKNSDDILQEELRKQSPTIVGVTSTSPTHLEAVRTAKIIRDVLGEEIPIIKGGPHETNCATTTLRYHTEIDVSVVGEGEETIVELVDKLSSKSPLDSVLGIVYRDGRIVKETLRRPLIKDLGSIPRPARELFASDENLQRYYDSNIFNGKRTASLLTTRGCFYNCNFCSSKTNWGRVLRLRNVEDVVNEIEDLVSEGYEAFRLEDDMSIPNRRWFLEFAEEIGKRGLDIEYSLQTRVSMINDDVAKALRNSGGTFVYFGVESGVQDILDRCGKGITLQQTRNAFELTRKYGVRSMATILFGLPGEDLEDFSTVRETIAFVNGLNPSEGVAVSYISLYPGSDLAEANGITAEEYERAINDHLGSGIGRRIAHGSYAIHTPELTPDKIEVIEKMLDSELRIARFTPDMLYSR